MIDIPETIVIQGRRIKEAHKRKAEDPDQYAARDIIKKSMNVGTVLMAEKMSKTFMNYIHSFGFVERTGIYLPGETNGLVRDISNVYDIDQAVMSFGQGISVTGLQMLAAVSAIANDGMYVQPRIVKHQTDLDNLTLSNPATYRRRRVVSKAARHVLAAMESVVVDGTGRYASVNGYRIGGKTGTAQKPLDNGLGYEEDTYIASFLGVFQFKSHGIRYW